MARTSVLYLLPTLMTGGLERMVVSLATGLDAARFAPRILCFERPGPFAEIARNGGVPVDIDLRRPGYLDVRFVRHLAARLAADPPDLVHAHNSTALVYGAFAARLAGGVPLVYTEHDRTFPGAPQNRVLHFAAGRMATRIVTVAEWLRRALMRHEGFDRERLDVIPNGIDAAPFLAPVDRIAARRALDLSPDAPVVACVARLAMVKNHDALLRAWRRIADVWPDATLLLVGDGPRRDALRELAGRLSLGVRHLQFLGDRHDVPAILAAADLHVLASRSEGMSLTLLEAMAAGKASVATAVGGNPEVIEDGRTGLLVESGDVHALASAVGTLLQDRSRAARMGAEAREVFQRRFTLDAMIRAYERVYEEVAARRREGARATDVPRGARESACAP